MTNAERLAEIQQFIDEASSWVWSKYKDEVFITKILQDVPWMLQLISEYDARIAAYELEIKELKSIVPFSKHCPDCGFPRITAVQVTNRELTEQEILERYEAGPPPGSTLLSESQHTLAARIRTQYR